MNMGKQVTINRTDARKAQLAASFAGLPKLTSDEKMKIALQQGCSLRNVERYMNGEIRKVSFGESLLAAIRAFIEQGATAAA